ncbi:MAG: type II toxin-antitoxin system RelE/ParE family toxin, partial [Lachnospiraceae bacterium]|nr:type II toxin-antitoxin system RelE/ParE family toxin [Lachnospiraceae bacterium]
AAERVYQSIQSQLLTLENMPARYNVVSDEPYASMGVRLMPVENYNAFFIISESDHEVHVIRILYNRRDWQSILQINSSDLLS